MIPRKKNFMAALGLACVLLASALRAGTNVILIMTDDQGHWAVNAHGSDDCRGLVTPNLAEYENHGETLEEIGSYLAYYNLERKHSALGYLTPTQFENLNQPPI